MPIRKIALFWLLTAFLAGCATTGTNESEPPPETPPAAESVKQPVSPPAATDDGANDPFEGFNRAMYAFNDWFDTYVGKPVAKGYRFVTPEFIRVGISNFLSNLREPLAILNNFLQGKWGQALSDTGRFLVNTTVGLAGLIDVAQYMDLYKHDEDFGQTLGVWGVPDGPYLVLPFLGPSNVRDGLSLAVDWVSHPASYIEDVSTRNVLIGVQMISKREQLLDATDLLEQAGGKDPYVFVREAYRQRRKNLVYDGNPPKEKPDALLFEDDDPAPPSSAAPKKE